MRIVIFCHSLISDWNHGNAHFLRGVVSELLSRDHDVAVYEPRDAWSLGNLVAEHGTAPLTAFERAYPGLASYRYDSAELDPDTVLDGADLVLVHEWNEPELVARIGAARAAGGSFHLLFHDTHHRAVTAPHEMREYDLRHYDGVLAFGSVIRDIYLEQGWTARAWTWHEAADPRVFHPHTSAGATASPRHEPAVVTEDALAPHAAAGDLVWIGNWGDDERSEELREFLVEPVRDLGLRATVHGVRYPPEALRMLEGAGIAYGGWLPNFAVPRAFSRHRITVHVPRRPYAQALPGIPTIRPFEALACRIPLVSAPWDDTEGLFTPGTDFLIARDGAAMRRCMRDLLNDPALANAVADAGHRTVLARHTCAHRVDELLAIHESLAPAREELIAS